MNVDSRIATEVMGWKKVKYAGEYFWSKSDDESNIKSIVKSVNAFRPTERLSQAMSSLEEARKKGVYIDFISREKGFYLFVYKNTSFKPVAEKKLVPFKQLPKTICEMILKALDAKERPNSQFQ